MQLLRVFSQIILLLNFEVAVAADDVLPNPELYAKCYAKITDHPVEMNSADYLKVAAGTLDPITGCMNVLNAAMFKTVDKAHVLPDQSNEISRSILRNFQQFHSSWFTSNIGGTGGTAKLIDMSAPALYITDALFGKLPFKSIVTATESPRGIRSGGSEPQNYIVNGANLTTSTFIVARIVKSDTPVTDQFEIIPTNDAVPVGALTGIEPAPAKIIPLPTGLIKTPPLSDAQLAAHVVEFPTYDISQSHGGGILGSPANFYNNDEGRYAQDGGLHVHRRWAANSFYDLMCAKLPNLQPTDAVVVAEFEQFKGSSLPFRQNKTCLSCHVSLDNFAHVARNIQENLSSPAGSFLAGVVSAHPELRISIFDYILSFPPTKPAIAYNDSDALYHRRAPDGKLVYRNFNNVLINVPVSGLQDLGEKIAAQDDIYMCAAKRYYSFLTGIDVSMAPISVDSVTKKPKDADKFDYYHRQVVVGLSRRLKTGGSLQGLIQDILNTSAFKARNPSTVEGN